MSALDLRRAALALVGTLAACTEPPQTPTGLIVELDWSALQSTADFDAVEVRVRGAGIATQESRRFLPTHALPLQVGVQNTANDDREVTIEATAFGGNLPLVQRRIETRFAAHLAKAVSLTLDPRCLLRVCPAGLSCVPGYGCLSPRFDPSPPSGRPHGESCRCNDPFPICVGASWRYLVLSNGRAPVPKRWFIVDHGPIGDSAPSEHDLRYGKADLLAYLQVNDEKDARRRRWISRDENGDIRWQKDELVDSAGAVTTRRYYSPGRLRFLRRPPTTLTWDSEFTEITVNAMTGVALAPQERKEQWALVSPPAATEPEAREALDKWAKRGLTCQQRTSMDANGQTSTIFCFVEGVGKVYEVTPRVEEELLVDWDVPGCPKVVP